MFFKKKPKSSSQVTEELNETKLELTKAHLRKPKSEASRASIKTALMMFVGLSVAAIFGPNIVDSVMVEKCEGVCYSSINQKMYDTGYRNSGASNGKKVFKVNYFGGTDLQAAENVATILDDLFFKASSGDVVLMHIESPGGTVISCGHTYDRLMRLRTKGVVIVSVTDYMAASCGYEIAAASDYIHAAPSAMVGNVGAVMKVEPSFFDLLISITGQDSYTIGSSRLKELLAGDKIRNDQDVEILRNKVKRSYEDFKERILKSRSEKISKEDYELAFSGDIFTGKYAKDLGLVDDLADSRTVLSRMYMAGYEIYQAGLTKNAPSVNPFQ